MRGVKQFNYANDADFAEVLERYGGREYLEGKFPRILQMLYDSREYHRQLERGDVISKDVELKDGYEDDFRITLLPVQPSNAIKGAMTEKDDLSAYGIYSASKMSLVDKCPVVHMSGKIYDPVSGMSFASFSGYDYDVQNLKKVQTVDHHYLRYTNQPTVVSKSNFSLFDLVNGMPVCTKDQTVERVISLKDMKPVVKHIEVFQPCSKTAENTDIRIVYNGRNDPAAAYNFANAKKGGLRVNTYYPFWVKVTLDDLFEFNPVKPTGGMGDAHITLKSNIVSGGAVHFADGYRHKIEVVAKGNVLEVMFKFVPGKDPNVSVTDANYWGTDMTLGAETPEGFFDFHLDFGINYGFKSSGVYNQSADIIVSSEDLPLSDNFVKIKKSKIVWGCLGKDTMIRTEKGYLRIEQVRLGEKIYTDKGYIALKNMVTGTEEKIIAVGVEGHETLLITSEHPVASERGVIRAIELLATDKLRMEDGTYQDINYLEMIN